MSVTFTEEFFPDGTLIVALLGTLDAPNAMGIEEPFKEALLEQGGNVIVDLSGVDYMSSYGLRMLLVGAKALFGVGGSLHLAAPNEHVYKIISMTGYDSMFPVSATVEEAYQRISSSD
nr:STAS domain-containing protein [Anaerolineae bacterium]